MAPKREQLPRLNLPRFNISQMEFSLLYSWNDEVARLFEPLINGGAFVSGTLYKAQGHQHLIVIEARKDEDTPKSVFITVRFDASTLAAAIEIPKEGQREREFVACILALHEKIQIGCTILFSFESVEMSELWFPLPTRVGGTGTAVEEFEIRGVRGAKLTNRTDDQEDFGFILDRPSGDRIYLQTHFHLDQRFTLNVPQRARDRSIAIAEQLVGPAAKRRRI